MELTKKNKVIIGSAALLVSFAVGRFSTPEHIKIQKEIVTVEKEVTKTVADDKKHTYKETTTVQSSKPDGETQTTTKVVEDTKIDDSTAVASTDDKSSDSKESKEVTKGSSPVTISALAGVNVTSPTSGISYGISVYKPVLGPIGLGVFVFNTGLAGASVGISF